jgi:hypothetical protein
MAGPTKPKKSKAAAVVDGLRKRLSAAVESNQTLKSAGAKMRRLATDENKQKLLIGGGAAAAGTVAGYKGQAYIAKSTMPEMAKAPMGVPLLTLVGAAVAAYGAFQLKDEAQAAVAGFGGGVAGGAFVQKLSVAPPKAP